MVQRLVIAVPITEGAEAPAQRRSRLRTLFGWLLHLQNMVLLAYLFWVMFDPKNLGLLSAFYILPPLWLTTVLLGVWCWWRARDTATLLLALWGGCAAVFMLAIQSWLVQAQWLPLANGVTAQVMMTVGMVAYPLVLCIRLLLRLTKPRAADAPQTRVSLRVRLLQMLVTLLAVLALLLAYTLSVGGSWLGKGTFEPWLYFGLWTSLATAFLAGPFALLSMLRRSQPLGLCLWILAALVITTLCYFTIFVYIAIHSAG